MRKNKTNEAVENLKKRMNLYVIRTYTDAHIRRHLGLLAKIVLELTLTVMMLHQGYDTVTRLNVFDAEK